MTLGGSRIEPTGKVKNLEAEIARLRAALEEIAAMDDSYRGLNPFAIAQQTARKALAKEGK